MNAFEGYIGQTDVLDELRIQIASSQITGKPLPHMIFDGPPGLGKTTIARLLAKTFNVQIHEVMSNAIKDSIDLVRQCMKLNRGGNDIIFIDEIHRLPAIVEEAMYPVMDLNQPSIHYVWKGKPAHERIPRFTLIGATTMAGLLSQPLLDRFVLHFTLKPYTELELAQIVATHAIQKAYNVTPEACGEIAIRSKGVARIALMYMERCVALGNVISGGVVTREMALRQFDRMNVDEIGLDEQDRNYLGFLYRMNRPAGIGSLAASLNLHATTIENLIEPFLLRTELVMKTPRGRMITEKGKEAIL